MPRFSAQPSEPPPAAEPRIRSTRATPSVTGSPGLSQSAPDNRSQIAPVGFLSFLSGAMLVMAKSGTIPELATAITGVNLRLGYLLVAPAYIAAILSPWLRAVLKEKAVLLFLAFFCWMALATPFSSWVGGSFSKIKLFATHLLPIAIVVPALVITLRHVRIIFSCLALSSIIVIIAIRLFGDSTYGRLGLSSSGVIGNPNDLAAHLVWLLPFVLYVVINRHWPAAIRLAGLPIIAYSLYMVASTGSRGAIVALAAAALFFFWKANVSLKLGVAVAAVVAISAAPVILPDSAKQRLNSLFGDEHTEAEASRATREYLFFKSLEFTATHPVFGVGPGQFATYEGKDSISQGITGSWHATHCTWTEISSESGIPALLFFLGALWCTAIPILKLYSAAQREQNSELALLCITFLLAFSGYCVAATFLSHSFSSTFPLAIGIGVALSRAGRQELNATASTKHAKTAHQAYSL